VTTEPATTGLPAAPLALVTGATGYIGGRLVPELLAAGIRVRMMARHPRHLADRPWRDRVEVVQGDAADPDSIEGIGGRHGWYSWRLGWWARGLLDRIFGGPGLRRGRRHPDDLSVGEALDWWRVEDIEDRHLLRLRAEMRLPGLAWLELIVDTDGSRPTGRTLFRQRALFHPRGLAGHLYWKMISPFHGLVFGGMQRNIALAAERLGQPAYQPVTTDDGDQDPGRHGDRHRDHGR